MATTVEDLLLGAGIVSGGVNYHGVLHVGCGLWVAAADSATLPAPLFLVQEDEVVSCGAAPPGEEAPAPSGD